MVAKRDLKSSINKKLYTLKSLDLDFVLKKSNIYLTIILYVHF